MTDEQRFEFLFQSIESHDRQISELVGLNAGNARRLEVLQDAIEKLVTVTNEDATAIRQLARLAASHDQRISQLEQDH